MRDFRNSTPIIGYIFYAKKQIRYISISTYLIFEFFISTNHAKASPVSAAPGRCCGSEQRARLMGLSPS